MTRVRRPAAGGLAVLALLAAAGCGSGPAPSTTGASSTSPSSTSGARAQPSHRSQTPVLHIRRLRWHLTDPVAREAVITTGTTFTIAGGLVGGDSSTAAAWRLDAAHHTVARMPALKVPVHDTAGAAMHGRQIVIGGGNAAEQSVVQRWNGRAWRVVGHLPEARSDLVAATVDGRTIVLGGYNGSRPAEPDILASTDGRSWKVVGRLALPVRYAASTVADGSVWLFGGERSDVEQTAIQRIDPATGRVRIVAHLPHGLGHAAAIPLGDRILIVGGRTDPDTVTDRMWWFDPPSGRVQPAGRLPTPLADTAVAEANGTTYLVGGETPRPTRAILAVTYR